MKKTIATTMIFIILIGITLAGCARFSSVSQDDPVIVPFIMIPGNAYQGFVRNWDNQVQPVLCVLMRSESEWNYWFHPAATMHGGGVMRYSDDFFERQQLLLAVRVMDAPDSVERRHLFKVDKVAMRDGALSLHYQYNPPRSGATYQVKEYLLVAIPKDRYTVGPVQFIENGNQVCEIAR